MQKSIYPIITCFLVIVVLFIGFQTCGDEVQALRGATDIQLTTIADGTHLTSDSEESMGSIKRFESF